MPSIDDDAKLIGIDEKVWQRFKKMYVQDDLPGFLESEAKARESKISYDEWFEHKRRQAMRWFGYYRKCKDGSKIQKISEQYNKIACMLERDR